MKKTNLFIKLIAAVLVVCTAAMLFAGCNKQLEGQLSVSPAELSFSGDADTLSLTVTSSDVWALTKTSGTSWCKTSRTDGKGEMTIDVIVKLTFHCEVRCNLGD